MCTEREEEMVDRQLLVRSYSEGKFSEGFTSVVTLSHRCPSLVNEDPTLSNVLRNMLSARAYQVAAVSVPVQTLASRRTNGLRHV